MAAAVELVVGQIHRHERSSPQIPHTLPLDGVCGNGGPLVSLYHSEMTAPACAG